MQIGALIDVNKATAGSAPRQTAPAGGNDGAGFAALVDTGRKGADSGADEAEARGQRADGVGGRPSETGPAPPVEPQSERGRGEPAGETAARALPDMRSAEPPDGAPPSLNGGQAGRVPGAETPAARGEPPSAAPTPRDRPASGLDPASRKAGASMVPPPGRAEHAGGMRPAGAETGQAETGQAETGQAGNGSAARAPSSVSTGPTGGGPPALGPAAGTQAASGDLSIDTGARGAAPASGGAAFGRQGQALTEPALSGEKADPTTRPKAPLAYGQAGTGSAGAPTPPSEPSLSQTRLAGVRGQRPAAPAGLDRPPPAAPPSASPSSESSASGSTAVSAATPAGPKSSVAELSATPPGLKGNVADPVVTEPVPKATRGREGSSPTSSGDRTGPRGADGPSGAPPGANTAPSSGPRGGALPSPVPPTLENGVAATGRMAPGTAPQLSPQRAEAAGARPEFDVRIAATKPGESRLTESRPPVGTGGNGADRGVEPAARTLSASAQAKRDPAAIALPAGALDAGSPGRGGSRSPSPASVPVTPAAGGASPESVAAPGVHARAGGPSGPASPGTGPWANGWTPRGETDIARSGAADRPEGGVPASQRTGPATAPTDPAPGRAEVAAAAAPAARDRSLSASSGGAAPDVVDLGSRRDGAARPALPAVGTGASAPVSGDNAVARAAHGSAADAGRHPPREAPVPPTDGRPAAEGHRTARAAPADGRGTGTFPPAADERRPFGLPGGALRAGGGPGAVAAPAELAARKASAPLLRSDGRGATHVPAADDRRAPSGHAADGYRSASSPALAAPGDGAAKAVAAAPAGAPAFALDGQGTALSGGAGTGEGRTDILSGERGAAEARGSPGAPALSDAAPRGTSSPAPSAGAAQQIAEAVRQGQAQGRGAVEVALQPEDLGRVRLSFTAAEAGLTVTVQAERPETLEMLRRHIDLLGTDLRERGFGDVNFEFGRQNGGDGRNRPPPSSETAADAPPGAPGIAEGSAPDTAARPAAAAAHRGLDLRL